MRSDDDAAFGRLGQSAIRASADTAARLSTLDRDGSARQILHDIERLANACDAAPVAQKPWWSRRRHEPVSRSLEDDFGTLVERLDRERDAIARQTIVLQGDRARFAAADRTLEEALDLIRALGPVIEAAVRELRGESPTRADHLVQHGRVTLPEREQAVLTQVAINRQAILTLDLMIANQSTLERALEQARTATLSALQVASAARRATTEGAARAQQSAALAQTARASDPQREGTDPARRMLKDAVTQALAAIAAAERPPSR